jgi:hypothetical protein
MKTPADCRLWRHRTPRGTAPGAPLRHLLAALEKTVILPARMVPVSTRGKMGDWLRVAGHPPAHPDD